MRLLTTIPTYWLWLETIAHKPSHVLWNQEQSHTINLLLFKVNVCFSFLISMELWLFLSPAPSGPPVLVGVTASINSSTNITVNWSPPVGGASGYVILYSTDGSSNMSPAGMTQLVKGESKTSSLLTGLRGEQTYAIRMFAYKDLPSMLSDTIYANLDGENLMCHKIISVFWQFLI